MEAFPQRKADLQEQHPHGYRPRLAEFKAKRKATNKHITYAELPEAAQFRSSKHPRASTSSTQSSRSPTGAETAMVQIVRQKMKRHDDARSLLRAIYSTEADILPDHAG